MPKKGLKEKLLNLLENRELDFRTLTTCLRNFQPNSIQGALTSLCKEGKIFQYDQNTYSSIPLPNPFEEEQESWTEVVPPYYLAA